MNLRFFYAIISVLTNLWIYKAYRILCVFPYNSKSHNILFESLTKGLAKRGHQVDVITHYPLAKPIKNYNNIINLNGTTESWVNNVSISQIIRQSVSDTTEINVQLLGNKVCHCMGLEKFQKLIKNPPNDPPYDLVLTEVNFSKVFIDSKRE